MMPGRLPSPAKIYKKEILMANKYSKSNNSSRQAENKSMQKYEEQRKKLNNTAKIMAIIVAIAMVVTTFLASGVFFLFFEKRKNTKICQLINIKAGNNILLVRQYLVRQWKHARFRHSAGHMLQIAKVLKNTR